VLSGWSRKEMRGKKVSTPAMTRPIPAARHPACVMPSVSGGGGGAGVASDHAGGATDAALVGDTGMASGEPGRGARHFAKMIPHAGQSAVPSGTSVEQRGQVMDGMPSQRYPFPPHSVTPVADARNSR
jgi:hypothetical protein